jgi:predicted Zn finger-like uncharacterized protein
MIAFSCPDCNSRYRVKDELAGKRTKCPKCGHDIRLPRSSMASEIDPTWPTWLEPPTRHSEQVHQKEMTEDDGEPADSSERQKRTQEGDRNNSHSFLRTGFFVVAALLACCGAAGIFVFFSAPVDLSKKNDSQPLFSPPASNVSNTEKNMDYFLIQKTDYRQHGMRKMAAVWRSNSGVAYLSDLEGLKIVRTIAEIAEGRAEPNEITLIHSRAFVKDHGMNPKEWRDSFVKQFPESTIIFDEIEVMVKEVCYKQLFDIQGNLMKMRNRIGSEMQGQPVSVVEETFHKQRWTYMSDERIFGPCQDEVSDAIDKMTSIEALRKKVYGK